MGCVASSETAGTAEERAIAAQIDTDLRQESRQKIPELRLLLLGMFIPTLFRFFRVCALSSNPTLGTFSRVSVCALCAGAGESGKSTIAKVRFPSVTPQLLLHNLSSFGRPNAG